MSKTANIRIRRMQPDDLAFAAACTAGEGWESENQSTLEGFFLNDPRGCLLAEEHGQPIGICIATLYKSSGFIGELIVRAEARGKGVGAALLNRGVEHLRDRGAETVYLDGVLKAVQLYERNGFRKVCRSWRFSGHLTGKSSQWVRRMGQSDLQQVVALDQVSFGEDRSFFLQRRMDLFPHLSFVLVEAGQMTGFILGREGPGWTAAGPWVVKADSVSALELLHAFALEAGDRSISLGILAANQRSLQSVQSIGFEPNPDSPWRMALGPSSDLGASPNCLAIGSAAKG